MSAAKNHMSVLHFAFQYDILLYSPYVIVTAFKHTTVKNALVLS